MALMRILLFEAGGSPAARGSSTAWLEDLLPPGVIFYISYDGDFV
jgi:hypothetical protein